MHYCKPKTNSNSSSIIPLYSSNGIVFDRSVDLSKLKKKKTRTATENWKLKGAVMEVDYVSVERESLLEYYCKKKEHG